MRTLTIAILMLGACKGAEDRRPAAKEVPALEHATQQDLAKELDVVDAHGSWAELKHRWQGQKVRWNVTRYRALCTAERCNLAAFPIQRPAKRGWMPEVSFATGQYAALEATCGDKEGCEVTIEGTLEKLDVSSEMPTNVKLANVSIVTRTASR